ncbi:MAG TPA: UDP-glucose 4-epimerase GalE, partial [Clostridia bacterium]|nr:UDP-glucose 4-epimerase GalE [Clostridia bacterium]
TGRGVTGKELVRFFENVFGKPLNKAEVPPRPGDIPGCCASADRAWEYLGWKAELSVEKGIRDALTWDGIFENIKKTENIR